MLFSKSKSDDSLEKLLKGDPKIETLKPMPSPAMPAAPMSQETPMLAQAQAEQLVRLGNLLRARSFIVHVPDIGLFPSKYLGELLSIYSQNITQYRVDAKLGDSMFNKWMLGQLQLLHQPVLELSVPQMFYALRCSFLADHTGTIGQEFTALMDQVEAHYARLTQLSNRLLRLLEPSESDDTIDRYTA